MGQFWKKTELFLANFGSIRTKYEHLIGRIKNSRDFSCSTIGIHACSNKSTCGTLRVFLENLSAGFEHRVTQRLRIGQASGRCSQRELKIGRKDSTNVRHTIIARDAKDPNALCSQSCYRYWDRPSEVT